MTDFERTLSWLVFAGATCYARKTWDQKVVTVEEAGRRDDAWNQIWSLQRALNCTPIGAIRSC